MSGDGIATCAASMLNLGTCCDPTCDSPAVYAVLHARGDRLTECARCILHCGGGIAVTPFRTTPTNGAQP